MRLLPVAVALLLASLSYPQPAPRANGGFLLNNGWRLRPAGKQVPLDTLPMSSAVSPDGKYLLVLNGGYNPPSISVLDVPGAKEVSRTPVPDGWLGLTFTPKGNLVYVGGGSQAAVFEFSFSAGKLQPTRTFPVVEAAKRTPSDFIGDVALSPDGRLIYAADLYQDSIVVINPQSGRVIDRFKTGRRPYRILFHPDGKSFFVSSWADGSVLRHETGNGNVQARFSLAPHPTDMVWLAGKPKPETEGEAVPYVARIFVAASNTNSVRVLGVTEANDVVPIESINVALTPGQPAGMTPSALALSADGSRLFVACSDANAVAVVDVSESRSRVVGFVPAGWYPTAVRSLADGRLVVVNGKGLGTGPAGTASFLDPFGAEELAAYTKTVLENSPYRDSNPYDAAAGAGSPAPIENVIYVIQAGGEKLMPNQQKLAREFVLLDNFYVNGDSEADGFNWSTAAIASDYVQKLWPSSAAGRRLQSDFEGGEPAAVPPAGYLWNNAAQAGVSLKNYLASPANAGQASAFLRDLAGFEKTGQMPRLVLLRLGGSAPDNDCALGRIVQGVSKSRFWPKAGIFVLAASGGNAYRAPAFVISPYVKRRAVDSSIYNTTSMLRTIELILGLRPMTQFDAAARPMLSCFQSTPDLTPYELAQ